MEPYITLNTDLRKASKSDFERDFYKLMNNAVFGKTFENKRNRCNVHLVAEERRAKALVSRPTCQRWSIINEDLVFVDMQPNKILQDRPIAVGFCILDLSKEHMYQMHYNVILKRYGEDRARLLFTDTDSLCYHIKTRDLYEDMKEDLHHYDTSNYPPDHPLYSLINEKVLGKFKDELKGFRGLEFVGLRPKLYSLLPEPDFKAKMAVKGVKKSYVKKHVAHQLFKKTLFTKKPEDVEFIRFQSKSHKVTSIKQKKLVCPHSMTNGTS